MLNALAEKYGLPVIVSTHPRTRKKIESQNVVLSPLVQLLKPLGLFDYVHLQMNAKATLSDSGTISEESSILNFPPSISEMRTKDRKVWKRRCDDDRSRVESDRAGLAILESQKRGDERSLRLVSDYSVPNVSEKVVRIIVSYCDYINRVVWAKN